MEELSKKKVLFKKLSNNDMAILQNSYTPEIAK